MFKILLFHLFLRPNAGCANTPATTPAIKTIIPTTINRIFIPCVPYPKSVAKIRKIIDIHNCVCHFSVIFSYFFASVLFSCQKICIRQKYKNIRNNLHMSQKSSTFAADFKVHYLVDYQTVNQIKRYKQISYGHG